MRATIAVVGVVTLKFHLLNLLLSTGKGTSLSLENFIVCSKGEQVFLLRTLTVKSSLREDILEGLRR